MNPRRLVATVLGLSLVVTVAGCSLFEPDLIAQFDVTPVIIYAGDLVTLDAAPSWGSRAIVSYSWDLGDGRTVAGQEVTVSFPEARTYTIQLTIEDVKGSTSSVSQSITVYVRSGTELFREDFSDGSVSLGRWSLDPTWASEGDSRVVFIAADPGYALYVNSAKDRWHRRYTSFTLPPLRTGQRVVFSCRIMTLQIQSEHTFVFAPARRGLTSVAGSLPYYVFTSTGDGSYVREPTSYGSEIARPIGFTPEVYRWHTYTFIFDADAYQFLVDGASWLSGPLPVELGQGGEWLLLLGEESLTEACKTYYDEVRITIEE